MWKRKIKKCLALGLAFAMMTGVAGCGKEQHLEAEINPDIPVSEVQFPLARVNVLCVDKTGTITEPGMHVYDFSVLDGADQLEISQLLADFVAAQEKDNAL